MLTCECLYCRGDGGRKLVPITFEIAAAAGLVEAARLDRVTIKPTDQTFVIEGQRAVGCIRKVNRRVVRLCGCWVSPEMRGAGLGEMLVRHRIAFIEHHMSASLIDTYAFRKRLYERLGFEKRAGYRVGTTLLRKVVVRGAR